MVYVHDAHLSNRAKEVLTEPVERTQKQKEVLTEPVERTQKQNIRRRDGEPLQIVDILRQRQLQKLFEKGNLLHPDHAEKPRYSEATPKTHFVELRGDAYLYSVHLSKLV